MYLGKQYGDGTEGKNIPWYSYRWGSRNRDAGVVWFILCALGQCMAVRAVVTPKDFTDDVVFYILNVIKTRISINNNNLKYRNNTRFDSSSVEWSSLATLSCVRSEEHTSELQSPA